MKKLGAALLCGGLLGGCGDSSAAGDGGGGSTGEGPTSTSSTSEDGGAGTTGADTTGGGYRPVQCDDEFVVHDGSLVINENTDPQTVVCIDEVTQDLVVDSTETWVDLQPLHNLKQVGRKLEVTKNASLEDLAGLEGLEQVGALHLIENPELAEITALNSLERIVLISADWSLKIDDNDKLVALDGLSAEVGGSIDLLIRGNDRLRSLDGLAITFTEDIRGAYLVVEDNDALESVAAPAFETPPKVGGLVIAGNDTLESLGGTELLQPFRVDVQVGGAALRDLAALRGVSDLTSLKVSGPSLADLSDLGDLEFADILTLSDTTAVADFSDLTSLQAVQWLEVGDCATPVEPAPELTWDAPNAGLVSLDGLQQLDLSRLSVIRLAQNPVLTDLEALRKTDGYVFVAAVGNEQLQDTVIEDVLTGPATGTYTSCANLGSARPLDMDCMLAICQDEAPPGG